MNPYLNITLTRQFNLLRPLFPNLKEVTESVGMFKAYLRHYKASEQNNVAIVGDGHKPRTAALFATNSACFCNSIDPAFRTTITKIPKLALYANKVEDCVVDASVKVVLCVHAHSTLANCIKTFPNAERLFSMPCCVPDTVPKDYYLEDSYVDYNIASDKRRVNVYRRNS